MLRNSWFVCFVCCDRFKRVKISSRFSDESLENRILLLEVLSTHLNLPKESLVSAAQEFQESESLYCRTCAKWCQRILSGAKVNTAGLENDILRLQRSLLSKLRRLEEVNRNIEEGVEGIKATLDNTAHLETSNYGNVSKAEELPIPKRVLKLRQLFLDGPPVHKKGTSDPLFISNKAKEINSLNRIAPGFPGNFLVNSEEELVKYSAAKEVETSETNVCANLEDTKDIPTSVFIKDEPLDSDDCEEDDNPPGSPDLRDSEPDSSSATTTPPTSPNVAQCMKDAMKKVLSFNLSNLKKSSSLEEDLSNDQLMSGVDGNSEDSSSIQPKSTRSRPRKAAVIYRVDDNRETEDFNSIQNQLKSTRSRTRKLPVKRTAKPCRISSSDSSSSSDGDDDNNSDSDFEIPEEVKPRQRKVDKPRLERQIAKMKEYDLHMGPLESTEESPDILTWKGFKIIAKDSQGTLECGLCGETKVPGYVSRLWVTKQMREHIFRSHLHRIPCHICQSEGKSRTLTTYPTLRLHIESHEGPETHPCPICSKPFKYPHGNLYLWHLWTHKNAAEQQMSIEEGAVPPRRPSTFKYPRRTPGTTGNFLCSTCGRDFVSKIGLKNHLQRHMDKEQREQAKVPCPECGKLYPPLSLRVHVRKIHHGIVPVKRYACEYCGRNFVSQSLLAIHTQRHTKEFRFHCEVCGKGFASKTQMNSHATSHSEVREYQCSLCARDFKELKNLRRHKRSCHKGEVDPETEVVIV